MTKYYVNNHAQPNGDHEVHTEACTYLPSSKKYLGEHPNCSDAVREAKKTYPQSNGCRTCCYPCHTS